MPEAVFLCLCLCLCVCWLCTELSAEGSVWSEQYVWSAAPACASTLPPTARSSPASAPAVPLLQRTPSLSGSHCVCYAVRGPQVLRCHACGACDVRRLALRRCAGGGPGAGRAVRQVRAPHAPGRTHPRHQPNCLLKSTTRGCRFRAVSTCCSSPVCVCGSPSMMTRRAVLR